MSEDEAVGTRVIRVAIVDDHPVTSEGLSRILAAESDIELTGVASTVAEALALVEHYRPHVVLMDYLLPDGDGVEATKKILKSWPDTKILLIDRKRRARRPHSGLCRRVRGFSRQESPLGRSCGCRTRASRGQSVVRADELSDLLAHLSHTTNGRGQWLTTREIDVLRLLALGRTTPDIAAELFVSAHTVRNHISSILSKLGAHSKLEAVAVAARDGVISLERTRHEGGIASARTTVAKFRRPPSQRSKSA